MHPDWNSVFDLDQDGEVDLEDFFLFADIHSNQGATASP